MKALVIGGATIDVIATIEADDIECISLKNATNSFLMMEQGKKVEASRIDTQVGGGATNAAVAMARLGAEVDCVLKIGTDEDGELILKRLAEEKINTQYVRKQTLESTGKSIIVCSHERNAGIFVHRGANTTLNAEDITDAMFKGVDLVYVSTLSRSSASMFPKIVERAKAHGAFVACNPGIRQIKSCKEDLIHALQWVDLLALNKEEAEALAEGYVATTQSLPEQDKNLPILCQDGLGPKGAKSLLKDFAKNILNAGCSHLVVTNGSEGAYLCSDNSILFRPAIKCEVASSIGAGDAFNATIAFALVTKQTVWSALSMAAQNASSVACYLDTQSGLMTGDALKSRILSMDNSRIPTFLLDEEAVL